ncbi:hypothetical protein PAJ34TS1_54330 [Paenibacillus azoreducens]|uniref:Uncharacterized protein n=1 Tax=Paenibacillus azoreducens TaxID=116718 RepID=A0A919YB12_9BACL|nr:hypothetical protein J34TS1_30560 [Paenibacillus azoreducens]
MRIVGYRLCDAGLRVRIGSMQSLRTGIAVPDIALTKLGNAIVAKTGTNKM